MNSIGIRCNPNKICYSIVQFGTNEFSLINQELIIPKSFDLPNKLKYVRKTFLDIFREYEVITAGIRITEYNAQNPNLFRIMLEAVIQELIASSTVEYYLTGVISSISSKLQMPNNGCIKDLIDGKEQYLDISDWASFSMEHRECILVGFASKNH